MLEQHCLTQDYETPYKFNGKELDTETGLYNYGARYYDPRTSVFLSTDPLMEDYPNVNPYVYCVQNPVNLVDPTGMGPQRPPCFVILPYNRDERDRQIAASAVKMIEKNSDNAFRVLTWNNKMPARL